MKIIIVGTAYPLRGGIAHYNALLFRELKRGHDVTIITFKRQYPRIVFPGKTQEEAEGELLQVPSEPLIDSINPLNWVSVGRAIRNRAPDLIIFKYWLPFFGPCFGTIARVARRGTKAKVLFICDNIVPHEKRLGDTAFTRYAFGSVDYFIVQSHAVEQELLNFWPRANYKEVPHPVYSMFGEPVAKERARALLGIRAQRVVLFFGYVRRYKGLHVLLDAVALLEKSLDIHLLVVGEFYDDEERYRRQVADLKLEKNVTMRSDYVPNDQVGIYFSAADVIVLPYLSATQSGIAQIAYNFDKPVIASAIGGLHEVVINDVTGYLVPANDARALADSITRFYVESKETAFALNVRQEKRKYSWENLARAIEELART